jgi:integrase
MRSKGEGSITPLGRERFRIRWLDPIASRQCGRRVYPSKVIRGSRRDAQKALNAAIQLVASGVSTKRKRLTLWEMIDAWLRKREAAEAVRRRTLVDYRALLNNHVAKNAIGPILLSDLTRDDVIRWLLDLRGPEEKRRLSPRSIRVLYALVNRALREAVDDDLLVKNPASGVHLPRTERQEMTALTPEQAKRFLNAAREDANYALWALLVVTGLRPSEALALRWADLADGAVKVQRSVVWVGKQPLFGKTKTAGSRRNIPLDDMVIAALAQHRINQETSLRMCPLDPAMRDLAFCTANGTPLDGKNLRRSFRALLKRANLPRVRIYDLRHTTATLLLGAGENPKIVAERLGHSSVRQTLDTYSHVAPTMQATATAKLSQLLFPVLRIVKDDAAA